MKPATITTLITIFAIWLCQMIVIVPVVAGILTFVGEFAGMTTFAAQVTSPMLCPAGTTARIDSVDTGNSSNINPHSFRAPTTHGNQFNCVDAAGNIVATKSREHTDLWSKIVTISIWVILAGLALLFALPIGWIVNKLRVKVMSPKN